MVGNGLESSLNANNRAYLQWFCRNKKAIAIPSGEHIIPRCQDGMSLRINEAEEETAVGWIYRHENFVIGN